MIDWLTLKLPLESVDDRTRDVLTSLNAQICKFSRDGVIEWQSPAYQSIRSDSHQITMRCGTDFELMGSPARVVSDNNVFGSDDIRECAINMIRFASQALGVALPLHLPAWSCTRVDITENYDLGTASTVLNMLEVLSKTQGGHFQVSSRSRTVYWNKGSTFKMGKAYHKGPHLSYQLKKGMASCTPDELEYADRLIRLELKIGRHYIKRNVDAWWLLTSDQLSKIHSDYFSQLVGGSAVMSEDDVLPSLKAIAKTEGQAKAAFSTWLLIKGHGFSNARTYLSKATYHRHIKLLKQAGVSYADFEKGNIVPFRMKSINLGDSVKAFPRFASNH